MLNSIYIEITDACNLNCSFCPCGKGPDGVQNAPAGGGRQRVRNFMSSELFERCISEAAKQAQTVYFHILGEPTLHPGFVHYLKALESTPLKLNLTTNGTTTTRVGGHLLESTALRQVNFSTHAFGELERGLAERYLQGVLDFCQTALVKRPDLYINLRLWNAGNFPDADRQKAWNRFFLERVQRVFGSSLADEQPSLPSPEHFCSRHKSFPVKGRLYLHQDSRFEWPELDEWTLSYRSAPGPQSASRVTDVKGTCHALETHVGILHDGRVVACCLDHQGIITLGNIQEQSLELVLKSPLAKSLREGFEKHELRHPLCKSCSYCRRFK